MLDAEREQGADVHMPDTKAEDADTQRQQRAQSSAPAQEGAAAQPAHDPLESGLVAPDPFAIDPEAAAADPSALPGAPELGNAEIANLHVRIIALENLVIALLAEATNRQRDLAREMVRFISPRPGFTQHKLTVHAASHMQSLLERADQFREPPVAPVPYTRTVVFDEATLPDGMRREHRNRPGIWGVIRVLDGEVKYRVLEPGSESETILEPGRPGLIRPGEMHTLEPRGPVRLQLEFYREPPVL
jgi:tellurite resistance-related uncharacterized protein